MGNPRAFLLDEPSEGLAPLVVDQLAAALRDLKSSASRSCCPSRTGASRPRSPTAPTSSRKGRIRLPGRWRSPPPTKLTARAYPRFRGAMKPTFEYPAALLENEAEVQDPFFRRFRLWKVLLPAGTKTIFRDEISGKKDPEPRPRFSRSAAGYSNVGFIAPLNREVSSARKASSARAPPSSRQSGSALSR